jgi:hypothetical protein
VTGKKPRVKSAALILAAKGGVCRDSLLLTIFKLIGGFIRNE